ncbi:MAG: cyclohexanecarboxylate-CoA ligase [Actinomycetia bacterium]|nr:cyclohexanecarboxylate-CoA ligase [Actinomycetes bacterium]
MPQERSFWHLVCDAAARAPERVVLADDYGRTLTTAGLRDAAERVAAGLPVRLGMVVSWQLPTTLEACVLMCALARLGAVQNPVIPVLREREVALITKAVGTGLFITASNWRGFGHAEMGRGLGLDVIAVEQEAGRDGPLRLPSGDPAALPAPPGPSPQCRWLYFSSGTTADPKGARHSDATIIAASNAVTGLQGMHDGDVYPIVFPVTHIGGIAMLAAVLRAGGRLVMVDTWDPAATPERIAAHQPTILGSAQPFFRAYLDAQRRHREPLYPRLRCFVAGGAPTPPDMLHDLTESFSIRGVINSWGLTEFPVATSAAHDDPAGVLAQTVGRPADGVHVRVADGELRLKGPQCFLGYVDPAQDAAAFDDEGWFRTGDLGEIGADGNIRITGRLKDVIIRNAENISAAEVEDALRRHPGVADVAVIGLPDQRTGERVCAVAVPEPGHSLTLDALSAHCAQHGMAPYKRPTQLEVIDELPRNSMGKILRNELAGRFAR